MASTVESTALMVHEPESARSIAAFSSQSAFDAAQRMAKALATSSLVPKEYQGNIANCLVAMEAASRTGASVLMVMQNLHVIQGRPSWSAAFLIASVNSCGRFSPLRYELEGTESQDGWRCRAHAKDIASGDVLYGEWITWKMVKDEGWLSKAGSKWKTMPGQMMRYRAASFWTRTYAPEISLGMYTADEAEDIPTRDVRTGGARSLDDALRTVTVEDAEIVTVESPSDSGAQPGAAAGSEETEAQRAARLAEDAALVAQDGKREGGKR